MAYTGSTLDAKSGKRRSLPIRLLNGISDAMSVLGSVLIVFVMAVMVTDIMGRYFFNRPLQGVPEMVVMAMSAIVFPQLASALRAGRLIHTDVFTSWLAARSPRAAARVQALYNVLSATMFLIVFMSLVPLMQRTIQMSETFGTPGIFTFPKWPARAAILAGCALMVLQYLALAWEAWAEANRHQKEPS